jgi:hypothetical protein
MLAAVRPQLNRARRQQLSPRYLHDEAGGPVARGELM